VVLSRNSGHPTNDLDGHEEKWLPASIDVVIRVLGVVPHILLYAYRRVEVSLQRVHNKCRIQMQPDHMAQKRALVKKNLSPKPASQLADDVLFILSHERPIVNHTSESVQRYRSHEMIPPNLGQFFQSGKINHYRANIRRSPPNILLPLQTKPRSLAETVKLWSFLRLLRQRSSSPPAGWLWPLAALPGLLPAWLWRGRRAWWWKARTASGPPASSPCGSLLQAPWW